mmetsp:Transcript_8314/g.19508  ORF Transcript_8314/g.19508 Transcript_8314/m.19508 type:complete len:82 (-) Transcript_8314:206-451(-)
MDLEKAEASNQRDALMIRLQVLQEMGSFDKLNLFLSREVRAMLVQAQGSSKQQFAAVLALLDQDITNMEAALAKQAEGHAE